MISSSVYNQVAPVAKASGVPDYIWQSIALMETGGDPSKKNVTKKEASYGLFQLNTMGGQGTAYKNNPEVLYDAKLNAEIAMPAISYAYTRAKSKGMEDGPDLAAWVAANSGHPGYGMDVSDSRIQRVKNWASKIYQGYKDWMNSDIGIFDPEKFAASLGLPSSEQIDKVTDIVTDPEKIKESLKEFSISTVILLLGAVFIILGMYIAVKG